MLANELLRVEQLLEIFDYEGVFDDATLPSRLLKSFHDLHVQPMSFGLVEGRLLLVLLDERGHLRRGDKLHIGAILLVLERLYLLPLGLFVLK